MTRSRAIRLPIVILVLAFLASAAQAQIGTVVSNWAVPSSSSSSSSGLHRSQSLADVTNPGTFVGVTPCRIVDTRGPAGPFGAPSLPASTPRSFTLPSGPCAGIPGGVAAYSLNITVTNTLGAGFISLYPTGGSAPVVSTLNYVGGQTIANAAIVPAGTAGAITAVAGVSGTDLIIDINGYTADSGTTLNPNEFVGVVGTENAGGLLYSHNLTTANFFTNAAVRGRISNTNTSQAIYGEQLATTGLNYGVRGDNASSGFDSAGVFGLSGSSGVTTSFLRAGVRGDSINDGVLGFGGIIGVRGDRIDSTGASVTSGILGGVSGVVYTGGLSGTGAKSFVEPHPTDASKEIRFVSLEGPEAGTYFRGRGAFVGGKASIEVPESFRMVTDSEGLTVQITPMGRTASVAVVQIGLDRIDVEATRDVAFSYLVQGQRRAYKDYAIIRDNEHFLPETPNDRLPVSLSPDERQRLINNGTYNADGTVNMATAERLGLVQKWRDREASFLKSSEAAAAAADLNRQHGNFLSLLN
jgi:hypothetical protein